MKATDKPTPCANDTVTFDNAAEGDPNAIRDAKAACATCELAADCLADALKHEGTLCPADRWGIYGGLTPSERARLKGVASVAPPLACGVCGLPIEGRRGRQLFHLGNCTRVAAARRSLRNAARRAAS